MTFHQTFNSIAYCVFVGAHLLGGVSVTQGKGIVLDRLEVHRYPEWRAKLIVSRVALAYADG